MGKLAIFNRRLLNYQRVYPINIPLNHYKVPLNHYFQRGWNHQPVVCVCVSPGLELNSTSRHGFWHLVQKGVHVCLLLCLQRDVVLVLLRQREELEVFTKSRGSKEDSPISLIVLIQDFCFKIIPIRPSQMIYIRLLDHMSSFMIYDDIWRDIHIYIIIYIWLLIKITLSGNGHSWINSVA